MFALTSKMLLGALSLAFGALIAVALLTLAPTATEATPPKSYIQPGILETTGRQCHYWYGYAGKHPCWHTSFNGPAIDYSLSPGDVAGKSAYLYFTGSGFQVQPIKLFTTDYCRGVDAHFYQEGHTGDDEYYYKGSVRYLHVIPRSGVNGLVPSSNFTWLGWVVNYGEEVQGCAWDAPNLHQDANNADWTPFYTNWYGNHPWTYSHEVCWLSCP